MLFSRVFIRLITAELFNEIQIVVVAKGVDDNTTVGGNDLISPSPRNLYRPFVARRLEDSTGVRTIFVMAVMSWK